MDGKKKTSWIEGLRRLARNVARSDTEGVVGKMPRDITRPFGKGRDVAWRGSQHFLSRHSRANRRKAARNAKAGRR